MALRWNLGYALVVFFALASPGAQANDDCQKGTSCPLANVQVTTTTVAALPTCNSGTKGMLEIVTDALLPTFLGTVSGGGTNVVLIMCDGSTWHAS